ncbi:hypothetical protein [Candidatus Cyanaurora vandensis]|uniref:hypothetical protein n=1 Tax=Candidatus Cyanaurora vandensis TaxID=2714958 RepID=UPI00257A5828|nr:hypothetical protein [Candidatus Cyanaurora vandensis]
MKWVWAVGTVLVLAGPVLALELSGTWTDDNGRVYTIQQSGKKVTIQGQQGQVVARLSEDDSLVQAEQVTFQWVDDDTLVLKAGRLGQTTRLRRQ